MDEEYYDKGKALALKVLTSSAPADLKLILRALKFLYIVDKKLPRRSKHERRVL